MTEEEFSQMVKAVREAEKAIGQVDYTPMKKQIKGQPYNRSLCVVRGCGSILMYHMVKNNLGTSVNKMRQNYSTLLKR